MRHGQARCATTAPTRLHTNVTYETHFSACQSRSVVSRGGVPCWAAVLAACAAPYRSCTLAPGVLRELRPQPRVLRASDCGRAAR